MTIKVVVATIRCATHSWIEHASSDTIENPNINSERAAKRSRNVKKSGRLKRSARIVGIIGLESCLSTNKSQHKKHKGPAEFANDYHEEITETIRGPVFSLGNIGPASV